MQNEICEDCWDWETHKEDLLKKLVVYKLHLTFFFVWTQGTLVFGEKSCLVLLVHLDGNLLGSVNTSNNYGGIYP
jgi:hypothetical protein